MATLRKPSSQCESRLEKIELSGSEPEKIGEGMMMMKFRKKRSRGRKRSTELDWEVVIDETRRAGGSGSMINFFDAQVDVKSQEQSLKHLQQSRTIHNSNRRKQHLHESTPRVPSVTF
ncbi:hypothetical protein Dimus_037056, partial [Dionaea muscipula]